MGKKAEPEKRVRCYGKTKPKGSSPKKAAKKTRTTGKDGHVKQGKKHETAKPRSEKNKGTKETPQEKEKPKTKERSGSSQPAKRLKVRIDSRPVVVEPAPKNDKGKAADKTKKGKEKDQIKVPRASALKVPATPLKHNRGMLESQSPGDESASPSALGRDLAELERDRKAARKEGKALEQFLAEKSEKAVEQHMQKLLEEAEAAKANSAAETEGEDEEEGEEEEEAEEEESEGDELQMETEDKEEEEQKDEQQKEDAETSSSDSEEDGSDSSSEEAEENEKEEKKPQKTAGEKDDKTKEVSAVQKAEACAAAVESHASKQKANSISS